MTKKHFFAWSGSKRQLYQLINTKSDLKKAKTKKQSLNKTINQFMAGTSQTAIAKYH